MSPDLSFFVTDPERHDEKVDEFTFFFFWDYKDLFKVCVYYVVCCPEKTLQFLKRLLCKWQSDPTLVSRFRRTLEEPKVGGWLSQCVFRGNCQEFTASLTFSKQGENGRYQMSRGTSHLEEKKPLNMAMLASGEESTSANLEILEKYLCRD